MHLLRLSADYMRDIQAFSLLSESAEHKPNRMKLRDNELLGGSACLPPDSLPALTFQQ